MERSAWDEVKAAIAGAPYPVEVLSTEVERAEACLATLGITERSWLGAVVRHTGGLLIDHGWLRVFGSGHPPLPDVPGASDREAAVVTVGYDVLGSTFVWTAAEPGAPPTIHYFAPDSLAWEDLEIGYGEWLGAMISGAMTQFYETLRWPGWEEEVARVPTDHAIHAYPPPWSEEGRDSSTVHRRVVPFDELVALHHEH